MNNAHYFNHKISAIVGITHCAYCGVPEGSAAGFAEIIRPLHGGGEKVLFRGCYACLEERLFPSTKPTLAAHVALGMARHVIVDPVTPHEIDVAVAAIDAVLNG